MKGQTPIERIGRYQVLERVGKGGMGVLYRGFDPVLDREVAIKLMLADFTQDAEQMRPRFYREARAAAKLNHRNIVTIFEFAEESNVPYIVMEFLRGTPLGSRMGLAPSLTLDDKLSIVGQLCDGLSYAHEQGVVHRDVKPDNVFVLEDGSVKLLDFGIAKLTASNLTLEGDVLGSASYMSPEQVSGSDSVDGRADVFSTGVVLYELLTGHKPFEADSPTAVVVKILRDNPAPLETWVSGLPSALNGVVAKALAKSPDDRFPTADALSRELQMIRRGASTATVSSRADETRFASTQVLKSLRKEAQRATEPAVPSPTVDDVAAAAREAQAARKAAARNRTLVMAGSVALVFLSGLLFFTMRESTPSASSGASAPVSGAPATAVVQPPAPTPTAAPPAPAPAPASTAQPNAAGNSEDSKATPTPAKVEPAPVVVELNGAYPFRVLDGTRVISPDSTHHTFKAASGKTLMMAAPKYFLRQPVTVRADASDGAGFEWTAPGLGQLFVRSNREVCDVRIGERSLGNPPLDIQVSAGTYMIDIACDGVVVKSQSVTVNAGVDTVAAIR